MACHSQKVPEQQLQNTLWKRIFHCEKQESTKLENKENIYRDFFFFFFFLPPATPFLIPCFRMMNLPKCVWQLGKHKRKNKTKLFMNDISFSAPSFPFCGEARVLWWALENIVTCMWLAGVWEQKPCVHACMCTKEKRILYLAWCVAQLKCLNCSSVGIVHPFSVSDFHCAFKNGNLPQVS